MEEHEQDVITRVTPEILRQHRWWIAVMQSDVDAKSTQSEWEWFDHIDAANDYIDQMKRWVTTVNPEWGVSTVRNMWAVGSDNDFWSCCLVEVRKGVPELKSVYVMRTLVYEKPDDALVRRLTARVTSRFDIDVLLWPAGTLKNLKASASKATEAPEKAVKVVKRPAKGKTPETDLDPAEPTTPAPKPRARKKLPTVNIDSDEPVVRVAGKLRALRQKAAEATEEETPTIQRRYRRR